MTESPVPIGSVYVAGSGADAVIHIFIGKCSPYAVMTYGSEELPADKASVTKKPEAKSLWYNGEDQKLVTAGEPEGGMMMYALGTDSEIPPAKEKWSEEIPAESK